MFELFKKKKPENADAKNAELEKPQKKYLSHDDVYGEDDYDEHGPIDDFNDGGDR